MAEAKKGKLLATGVRGIFVIDRGSDHRALYKELLKEQANWKEVRFRL